MTGEIEKAAAAFRTITEVAEELQVPQHVLRFWETRFSAVRPIKRGGNRRYYRPEDLHLLKVINHLLYTEGYTIRGVQKLLREQGPRQLIAHHAGGKQISPSSRSDVISQFEERPAQEDDNLDADSEQPMTSATSEVSRTEFDPGPVSLLVDRANLLASLKQMRADIARALD